MKHLLNSKGFTLIETILVISIMGILLGTASVSLINYQRNNMLRSTADEISSNIKRVKSNAISSLDNNLYGIHFENNKYVVFKGNVYNSSDSSNEIFNLSGGLTFSNIRLDGSNNLIFSKFFGGALTSGTIDLVSGSKVIRFTINSEGSIEIGESI